MGSRKNRKGQGLVEFAFGAIILFTTLCAIFEFSWVFYNFVYLNNAVNKACRLAVVQRGKPSTPNDYQFQVWNALQNEQGGLSVATCNIAVLRPDGTAGGVNDRPMGGLVTVSATMSYPRITPLNKFVQLAGFGTLRSQCTLRIE